MIFMLSKCQSNFLNNNCKSPMSESVDHVWLTKSQSGFTCSKLTIETLEQGLKYVQS